MTPMRRGLLLHWILYHVSASNLSVVNVTFGEYVGSYEGFNEMGLFVPRIGQLKSAGHPGRPDMRRYSHLKLMISYMLGSGALAARYTSYGCHCLLGPDVARTLTRVPSVDDVDEVCRRQTMCMQCAKIDNDADCQGGVKGYSFHGERDPVTGQRFIVCDNTPGTCRHSLCLCDQALADGFLKHAEQWDESNHHEWGTFNARKQCSTSKPSMTSLISKQATAPPDVPSNDHNSGDQTGADFFGGFSQSNVVLDENEDEIILENKSGGGGEGGIILSTSQVYHAEAVSSSFENNIGFFAAPKAEESPNGMQCCGEYPERFPYQPKTGKACCGKTTYNTNIMQCCSGDALTTIGGC